MYVETLLDSNLLLRGIIDRLDVAPTGQVRIVDYKTGRAPGPGFEARALFQMKFYALVLWRVRGGVPDPLPPIYPGSGEGPPVVPAGRGLPPGARKGKALCAAIAPATQNRDWRP